MIKKLPPEEWVSLTEAIYLVYAATDLPRKEYERRLLGAFRDGKINTRGRCLIINGHNNRVKIPKKMVWDSGSPDWVNNSIKFRTLMNWANYSDIQIRLRGSKKGRDMETWLGLNACDREKLLVDEFALDTEWQSAKNAAFGTDDENIAEQLTNAQGDSGKSNLDKLQNSNPSLGGAKCKLGEGSKGRATIHMILTALLNKENTGSEEGQKTGRDWFAERYIGQIKKAVERTSAYRKQYESGDIDAAPRTIDSVFEEWFKANGVQIKRRPTHGRSRR